MRKSPQRMSWYETTASDCVAPVLELCVMCSTHSLLFLPDALWLRLVVPLRVPSISQIQLFNNLTVCKPMTDILFTNPSSLEGYDTRSIFKRSLTGLNSEFSFSQTSCLTKAEEHSLPYYLPITGGRIIGFIPFPRVLELCEMQSVSSRIWTRVAVSISCDDNHCTTGTSMI